MNCSSGWNTHVWTLLSLFWSFDIFNQCLFSYCIALYLACENIPFSSLFAAGEVSLPSGKERGETDVFAGYMLLKNDSLLQILRFPGYFETLLFRTFFHFPWDFEIAGFDGKVKGSNPVQAWIFSGCLFATPKVVTITAMIFFHIVVWIFWQICGCQRHNWPLSKYIHVRHRP